MPTTVRILEGPGKGSEFAISGETIIGRGAKAQVKVAATDVSWEHALLTRVGEEWMIENLSAHGTLVNEDKIAGRVRVRPRDRIRVGDETVLRFDSTDGPQASVLTNPWTVRLGAAFIIILLGTWIAYVMLKKPEATENWSKAYEVLWTWVDGEVHAGRMSVDFKVIFEEARRLDVGAIGPPETPTVAKQAADQYQKVQLLLNGLEPKYGFMSNSADHPAALRRMLLSADPNPSLDQTEITAALEQFVRRKLDALTKIAAKGKS